MALISLKSLNQLIIQYDVIPLRMIILKYAFIRIYRLKVKYK